MYSRSIASVFVLLAVSAGSAHDLWLLPDAAPAPGQGLVIRANQGMDFPKSESAPDPSVFKRRLLIRPDGTEAPLTAAGKEGGSGLMRFEAVEPGVYVAAVETNPKMIKLSADAFNAYLVSDGLPHIYRLRANERTLDQPAHERYSKSPKALLQVGRGGKGDPCRVVGLPLEIVPLHNPFALKVGDTLRVRVLFRGQPLPDANLGWCLPNEGTAPRGTTRADGRGEALIPIARTGLMTIRLTHMTRPKTADNEWESFWTTLTFGIPQ